ncbi:MAG: undecaprenyl-diphosphate phosphatase [Dorea sp.]|nr:undecaprenyl-diphosphate phosphatase [Dorea sp.]MDY2813646.1 undecaprenyl-diphosphate phosphatase [Dorea sp.]
MLDVLKVIILGIVEGITEWLPVSSTGHLILVGDLLQPGVSDEFMEMFNVVIQLGAIMAVVVLYFHKLNPFSKRKTQKQKMLTWQMWIKVLIASVPAAIVGLLFNDILDELFYKPLPVAIMLIVYGVLFILIENKNAKKRPEVTKISQLSVQMLLWIGFFQMLALIPGTSRSGATIIGALIIGVSRETAAEFTFFLAIPVMFGASLLKLIKFGFHFTGMEFGLLMLGCLVSFGVSVFAIKFLMGYIKKHDFKVFGYYRIILGAIIVVVSVVQMVLAK